MMATSNEPFQAEITRFVKGIDDRRAYLFSTTSPPFFIKAWLWIESVRLCLKMLMWHLSTYLHRNKELIRKSIHLKGRCAL